MNAFSTVVVYEMSAYMLVSATVVPILGPPPGGHGQTPPRPLCFSAITSEPLRAIDMTFVGINLTSSDANLIILNP